MGGPFRYAGVENGDACHCGNADDKFIPTDPGECNIPCTGDLGQFCGSSWRLQVFNTKDPDVDYHEYTEAPAQGPTTTSQPEIITSPTSSAVLNQSTTTSSISTTSTSGTSTPATPNAVLVLNTRESTNKPMVLTFDGNNT